MFTLLSRRVALLLLLMPTVSASDLVQEARRNGLTPKTKLHGTGYVGVSDVKGKYQARFFDKSRGKQRAVPGLYKTALEAALALAWAKHLVKAHA